MRLRRLFGHNGTAEHQFMLNRGRVRDLRIRGLVAHKICRGFHQAPLKIGGIDIFRIHKTHFFPAPN
jgi:hypothetical protein